MKDIIIILVFTINVGLIQAQKKYEIIFDDGIYVEKFDSSIIDQNRFTSNNITFPANKEYSYNYYYQNPFGEKYLCKIIKVENKDTWEFTPIKDTSVNTVTKVILKVVNGLEPFIKIHPDYNQTVIKYKYILKNSRVISAESTGLIENEKNIWFHPPRNHLFKILEINPFPFIQKPYSIGNKWSWELEIGSFWGDKRWKTWTGNIISKTEYQITSNKEIITNIGKIECFEITGVSKSKIGETKLISYFNKEYGFIRLNYTNIDGSKVVFNINFK